MKNILLSLSLILSIGTILTLNSCKKTEATVGDDSLSAQDAATIANAIDQTSDDASAAVSSAQSVSSSKIQSSWIALCGATVAANGSNQIVITYDGTTDCYGLIRSGSVAITPSTEPWANMNSVMNVAYTGLKITDAVSGASYTVNGAQKVTNETGGLAWEIAYGLETHQGVIYRNQASINISFANGQVRTWTVDRSRDWYSEVSGQQNAITASVSSEASGNVDISGTDRFGNTFSNVIVSATAADNNSGCQFKPFKGEMQQQIAGRISTILFGTDAEGTQIGSPTICGTGYFINYVNTTNGKAEARFVGYWL